MALLKYILQTGKHILTIIRPLSINMQNKKATFHCHLILAFWTPFRIVCLQIYETFYVSVQFSSVAQSCLTLCDPMNCSMPGLPVHHQLLEPTQTHVHLIGDAIQPPHPLLSPSPPALNLSQHQSLFQRISSSHQVAKVLELQLQSFQ